MNRESQSHIGLFQVFVVLGALLFFTCQSFAGVSSIYKWKDEQGKVHFTDDPLKIPPHYRSDPNLEKIRGLPSSRKQMSKTSADSAAEEQTEQDEKTDDSDAENEKKELASMQAALNFLKSDVQRYKKYKDYVPQHRHAVVLRNEIVNVIPSKDALLKKLGKPDSTLLKQVSSYLKISLQRDYEAKKREHPRRLIFISERTRINEEQPVKDQLIKKLTAKLASAPDKASSQPKPAKPKEPAKNSKQDASKNARNYGAYSR